MSQADVDHTNAVLRDYLEKDAGYESDEAVASSDGGVIEDERADDGMSVDLDMDDDGEWESAGWAVVRGLFGEEVVHGWTEGKGTETLVPAFLQLRTRLRAVHSAWSTADADSSMSSIVPEDSDKVHLAAWLNDLTEADLKKATSNDLIWWIVDMGAALKDVEA